MALIQKVKDDEERKRKAQAQANQTAQTATTKAAQQNSDAAKRNSAGANKAPTQSAAATIQAAKQKAASGNVTKTPTQYADKSMRQRPVVKRSYNYKTLGTQERVEQVASKIADPKEKQGFLDGWNAYTNTKSYKNDQKRKEQLQGLAGLYDADGRPININTASYNQVVQGIRSIADATKRKEAAAKLEEMTKTWGSRFHGQTYDKDIVTSYLGNPDFTEEDYKDEVAAFENAFYAQSGYEEQNTQTYIDSIMDIRNSGYSDSVQRQLKQRLDEVWKNTTGKKTPNLNEVSADLVSEYYERAKKQQEEEAAGDTKSWWENLIGFLGFGEEDEPEEKTEEHPTTSGSETKSSLPGGAVETGKVASGSVVDVAPNMVSYTKPEDVSYTAQNGAVDLSGDPIKAIIQYADKGLSGSLNAATKAAIDKYVHSSAGISAMWGVLSNENLNEYAYVGEDGKIASEKGNRLASDIYRDNYGILGSKMSSYALKIKDSSFPAVLREDAAGVLSTIIQQAETEAQLLPEQYDPDFVNIYDQFLENHPSAVDALAEAFAYEGEMKRANREAQALAAAEEQANKQKAIETSVEACRTGNGTVEDWDRVAELAAKVTKDQLYDDDFYMDMLTEIGIARSMSDRDLTNLDDWYNEKTTGWLLANGVDNDLTKVPAIQYKDFLNGHVRDALDQVAATAYSLGYKSLTEYNEKTGVLSGDLLYQIAWNNIQKAEKTTTDEVVDEANRIAYKGTDDSFGRTVEGIAYGMKTGFVDQTMAEGYEAIYNFAVSTNLDVDAARVRIKYINEYGYANAASAYIDHMTQLADGGYFPSEELTNYVKQALAGDGDAFALGIMPEDMGWAVEGAKEAQQKVADYQDWAQENLTEAQGLLSGIAVSTGHNTATQLIAKGMNLVFGGFGAAGQVISSMAAYGGFGGEFNETFKKSLSEHNMRESNLLGLTNSLAMSIANLETDKKFSGKVLDLLGVNTAVEMAVEEMGMPAATNIWKAMIGAFGKGTAKNLFDEVIHDEVMEGLWKNGLGAGVEYLLDATEGAVKLPNIQDVFLAGVNALVNIDAIGTMEDVIGNAPEAAIYMLPMAIMSGIVDGAQEWKSYKSLKQAAKTGDPADAKQAVEDLAEDLADPEKGKALSEGVNDAKKGKVAAQIMLKDEEISPLFEQAQMDFEQAKAHEAKAEANQAAIDTAVKTMMEAQERLDNGTGDDSDAQAIVDASEAIAKNKAGLDEAKREAKQKRDAGNKLYERITNIAMAKAGKQVSDERTAAAEELTTAQQEREAQTEADNVTAMEADNFIEQRYAGLSEEQKQRLREIYADTVKGKVNADFKAVDAAVRQFQKKFSNINFKVVDSLAGAEGGYVRDKNTVYIARDMTHSEIVNRVLIHELTHASEGGGKAYEEFRDALLRHKYKGDDAMIEADKASIAKRYNDHYAKNNIIDEKTGKVRIADDDEVMTELVADITGKILSGDEEAVNRLIAEEPTAARRIWDTIKRVLGKLVGVKGQGIDDLRHVEQLFAKALKKSEKANASGSAMQRSVNESLVVSPETNESLVGEVKGSAMQFSLRSWTDDERDTSLNQAVESIDVEELDSAYKQAVEDEDFFLIEDYFAKAAAKYAKDFDSSSYENVPDSLMGFRRNGSNKPYFEQKYGQSVTVYVSDGEGDAFVDVVKGQNVKHAMERAKRNWPDMDVKLLSTKEMDSVEFDENGELIPLSKRFSALAYEDTFVDNGASYLENMSEKDYNRFGWVRGNDVISPASWRRHDSLLANIKSGSVKASKNAGGMLVSSITDDNGIENIIVVSDGDTQSPTVERIFKIEKEFEDLVEGIRNAIKHAESRYGKDSGRSIERFIADGLVKRYSHEDFPTLAEHTRAGSNGKTEEVQGLAGIEQERRGNAGEAGNGVISRMQRSLPSDDVLTQEIQAYHELQSQPEAEQAQQIPNQEQQPKRMGERQFTTKTLQESPAVPQWLKNELYNNPEARFYEKETNNDQIVRSWDRLQKEGYEAMRDRVLNSDAQNPDNVADANMILAMANREGDTKTFLDVALHYAKEGTQTAKTLQARKIFSRMTPTGMKVWASGQAESNLAKYIDEHKPIKRKVDRAAKKVAEKIKDLQGGDELLRLQAAGEYTITSEDARWGVPINEKQRALIKEYGLEKVTRPGINYNRATMKQRMLEAILAEPNPENVTGNGLNLIQRLEYMKEGAAVITNADLDYMGSQMTLFAHSPVDDQEGRVGDLALARLYEAYGNITPATMAENAKTWRYTAMLLSFPSATRNVIGNAAQNAVNATAHGVATVLDWGVSKATGERTIAGLTFKERAEGWAAFRDETVNTFRDFYTDKAITSHGEDRHNLNQRGRVYQNGTFEMMRLTEGFLMSVGDRNFWKKAYVNSLAEQQRVADLNGEAFDYEAACERAEAEANYATFNEDSRVRDLLTQLKHPPEDASFKDKALAMAIDFLMPFTGVPTNITKRMIDYSPAGLAFTAIEHGVKAVQGKNFDQNAFVNGMARGLTGTALLAIGMELFKAGLVSLGTGDEEDKKIYGAETAQGRQYTPYIRVGDQYIALSTFMPAASAIIMGATAQKVFENDENALNAIKSACFASLDMIFDASYMSSLADIFGGYGTLGENAVDSLINSTISQNVPAILGQIASSMDPYVRDTKDKNAIMQALKSGLISKIPGLRQQLEAKVDITGEKVKNSKYGVALVDPFTRSYANDDPALQELIDFARESGDSGVIPELFVKSNKYEVSVTKTQAKALKVNRGIGANGKTDYQALTLDVTDEEKWDLNEKYGKLVFGELRKLLESRKWKRAEEAERIKLAEEIIKDAKLDILEDFLKERNVK